MRKGRDNDIQLIDHLEKKKRIKTRIFNVFFYLVNVCTTGSTLLPSKALVSEKRTPIFWKQKSKKKNWNFFFFKKLKILLLSNFHRQVKENKRKRFPKDSHRRLVIFMLCPSRSFLTGWLAFSPTNPMVDSSIPWSANLFVNWKIEFKAEFEMDSGQHS